VKRRKHRLAAAALFCAGTFLFAANRAFAQDAASSAPQNGPTSALRDLLMAACAQNQNDFSRFLTARNQASFAGLTPPARVAFMKRFVLLNEPGKPSVTNNPSGRPTVRCDTPAGAAEIEIHGADTHDNVAFLRVELREAGNSSATPVSVNMGLVREDSQWKILSLGVVLLDLPSLEIAWDAEEAEKNEQTAIVALNEIAQAVEAYRRKYTRLPESLAQLGTPAKGPVSADSAGLLDAALVAGSRDGYSFRYVIVGGNAVGAPAKFALSATPSIYGRTGRRSFLRDADGTLRGADHQGAVGSETDPKVPTPAPDT